MISSCPVFLIDALEREEKENPPVLGQELMEKKSGP